jgi:hypothetical protein
MYIQTLDAVIVVVLCENTLDTNIQRRNIVHIKIKPEFIRKLQNYTLNYTK